MQSKKHIQDWLKNMNIYDYVITQDMKVNVDHDVDLRNKNLTHIPIQFGEIEGNFLVSHNQLTDLKGFPQKVDRVLDFSHNQIVSLEGFPKSVRGAINANNNQINSFKGIHYWIEDDLDISHNNLTHLEGSPNYIFGLFNIGFNKIKNFKNLAPNVSYLYCEGNPIESFIELRDIKDLETFSSFDYLHNSEKEIYLSDSKAIKEYIGKCILLDEKKRLENLIQDKKMSHSFKL